MSRPQKEQRIKSNNGDLFIVTKGGRNLALGLVARGGKKISKLVYFFPINLYEKIDDKSNLRLHHSQAIWVYLISSLSIEDGTWPLVGNLKGFSLQQWPMPLFWRYDTINNIDYIVKYDEKTLKHLGTWYLHEVPKEADLSFVVKDGLAGCGYVEDYIELVLKGERSSNPWINVRAKQLH